jgi:hypothetical protein
MTLYSEKDHALRPFLQIAMPRPPRIYAPGGTMHVVARFNNREFQFSSQPDPNIKDRDSGCTNQRAVGSPEFLKRHHPSGRRRGIIPLPEQIRKVGK